MMLALALGTVMACIPVEGDRILARDLMAAAPAFAQWPPETELGYAPAPGVRRVLRAAELARLARRQGLASDSMSDLCVERPATPLTRATLEPAIALAVADPEARIEILDWSRYPAPRGVLEFPRAAAVLEGTGGTVLWKGFVRYGGRGRFSIWVRARIEVHAVEVAAREDLALGRTIQPSQLELRAVTRSPFAAQPARTLAEVVGRIPRHPIPAGSPILPGQLNTPPEIHGGDRVLVRVTCGPAGLKLEGVAGGDGRRGDFIPVKNPTTGRTFRARVEGTGQVAVVVPGANDEPPQGGN